MPDRTHNITVAILTVFYDNPCVLQHFLATGVPSFIPDDTIISSRKSRCLCPKSLISLWKLISLFPTAPYLFTGRPRIYAWWHLHDRVKSFDDVVIDPPCLFLTAHSEEMSIFTLRKRSKSSIFSGFLHSLRGLTLGNPLGTLRHKQDISHWRLPKLQIRL